MESVKEYTPIPERERAILAEAVLTCVEQDITIHEILSYMEDGEAAVAVWVDKERVEDVIINFGEAGISKAEANPTDDWVGRVYGIIHNENYNEEK